MELEQIYSEQLQTDTQLASLNNELILLRKEVEQETETLQIEYQKTIDALNFEFEEKIKNENDEDGINELTKEKDTKIDETARNLNTELNKLQEKIDFVSVEIEKRKNEILDERGSKERELQENFNKSIESLIPGTYHSLIENAIIDKGRELIKSLENFEESFSTHKHKDLIAFLNGNDWESQLQATLSYIQDTTLRDVIINTPELKFLGQSDRLLTLTIGELLDGGPNNPNQIIQTLIAEIRALIFALQFRDATKYNEITFPFEFIHGIRGQQKRFYYLKSEYYLDETIGWLLEMQNKATANDSGESSKILRKRANDEKASKETISIKDKINFIHTWLNKFGYIEEGGKIEAVQVDGAYVDINLYRTKEDFEKLKATSIADLGLGISQLLPIIISTAYYLDKNYLIAIEEPESHLHPKLQSMLADFMVDAISYGVRFLIETHSVYYIRKLEVLLVSQILPTDNLSVCYIKRNDETGFSDGQIIDLKITENGLDQAEAQNLWDGFYDEAERLKTLKDAIEDTKTKLGIKIKCLVLTEDEKHEKDPYLKKLLESCGFVMGETQIMSYGGCDKLDSIGIGMAKFAEELLNIEKIIFHQDADGLHQTRQKNLIKWCNHYRITKGLAFITFYNSIEGYFTKIEHIKLLYPAIPEPELSQRLAEFINDLKNNDIKRLTQKYNDEEAAKLKYDSDPMKYCDAKKLIKKVNEMLQQYGNKNIIAPNPTLLQTSTALIDDSLIKIAQEIWKN